MQLAKKIVRKIKSKVKSKIGRAREYKHKLIRAIKQKNYNVVSFRQWCEAKNLPITILETNKKVTIVPPIIHAAEKIQPLPFQELQAALPDVYLATLKNVTVIEGSDIVIADNATALYDEMAYDPEGKYEPRMNAAQIIEKRYVNPVRVDLVCKKNARRSIAKYAIHFCKDYSPNYFHWLIEALPRMSIIEKFPELDAVPLLIDDNLQPQQMELLHLINNKKRELIKLKQNEAYVIENLFYPSGLSHMHNNYYYPVSYNKDLVTSPDAIDYLRKKLIPPDQEVISNRNIYISRKNLGHSKRLINDEEISIYLAGKGFEIIYPEKMTIAEQIKVFSEANVIIGASGSAFANLVFAPKNCRVFVLSANNKQVNLNLFAMIAHSLQMECTYVLGHDESANSCTQTHNDFRVDIEIIESILNHSRSDLSVHPV